VTIQSSSGINVNKSFTEVLLFDNQIMMSPMMKQGMPKNREKIKAGGSQRKKDPIVRYGEMKPTIKTGRPTKNNLSVFLSIAYCLS